MKQHYTDEKTGISYTLQGDYYLPDLILPAEKEERHIGVWGQRHAKYLKQNHKVLYRKNSDVCSAHYIREKVVEQLVLESMQRVLWYVQSYEKLFAQRQLAEFGEKQKKELTEKRRELDKAKQRVREIDGVIQKLYEDNATGKISDERFATMSMSLENEQSGLKDRIPVLEDELENAKVKTEGLQRFIDKAKRVTRLEALTPELVHEFIEKIVVSAPEYKDGKRYQEVSIYYNGVGIIREPAPEEMEEYFQEHIKNKPFLKAKTA